MAVAEEGRELGHLSVNIKTCLVPVLHGCYGKGMAQIMQPGAVVIAAW